VTNVDYEGRSLRIGDAERDLPDEIEAVRTLENVIVVRFIPAPADESRNIQAFETDGSLRWTVEPTIGPSEDENPYVRISDREGTLRASDWKGMEYEIDLETGVHLDRKLRK